MSNLQFLPKASISSNTYFVYKDVTSREHRIKFTHEFEDKLENRHNIMVHLRPHLAVKEKFDEIIPSDEEDLSSAFDKAVKESYILEKRLQEKYKTLEQKREVIQDYVDEKKRLMKERLDREKQELEIVLLRIIRDALKFSKESTPLISMMPNKLSNAINQLKEERGLNLSSGSLNLSFKSNTSNRSTQKYESNAFLKALGLDLTNLNPNNIKIDIEKAYNFIKKWKIKKDDVRQVIRFKVVNEIMNVEERRSVQKLDKINRKLNLYIEKRNKRVKLDESGGHISHLNNSFYSNENNGKIDKKLQNNKESVSQSKSQFQTQSQFTKIKSQSRTIQIAKKSVSKSKSGEKKNNQNFTHNKNNNFKTRNKSYSTSISKRKKYYQSKDESKNKKKIVLNAYRHVDKLVGFINSSENLRENESLLNHFNNIKYNKKIDNLTKRLINKNKISTLNAVIGEQEN